MSRICMNRSGPGKTGVQFFVHVKTLQNMDIKPDYSKYMFLSAFLPRKHEQKHGHRFEPVRQQSVNL
jgi:CRISPR/Cas system CSM-associated protein Csm4 (group 5 of RAMP superfamily)